MKETNEFQNGDIVVNKMFKKEGKIIMGKVIDTRSDEQYFTVEFKTHIGSTLKQFFRLADENEIKTHKLKNMFKSKKKIKI